MNNFSNSVLRYEIFLNIDGPNKTNIAVYHKQEVGKWCTIYEKNILWQPDPDYPAVK